MFKRLLTLINKIVIITNTNNYMHGRDNLYSISVIIILKIKYIHSNFEIVYRTIYRELTRKKFAQNEHCRLFINKLETMQSL